MEFLKSLHKSTIIIALFFLIILASPDDATTSTETYLSDIQVSDSNPFNPPQDFKVLRYKEGDTVLGNFTYGCYQIGATDNNMHNCQCEHGSTFYWWNKKTGSNRDLKCWNTTNTGIQNLFCYSVIF